ncbi:nucleoside 2-deoxyribosyltransferase [Ruminococcus intestinalis]|uniref:nucleoside 2-deoxyribosyltransferase n=1 Tax=Ruminococcus intestinalis TaxID=2763066 RepID=UPI003F822230
MKIYLASPFFNDNEIANIHRAAGILKAKGHEVFVPMEHDVENRESLTNAEWAKEIFKIDKGGIDDCDAVVLLYGGMYSDSGTAWECGYAYASGKKVIVCCYNIEQTNLMIVNGCHAFLNGIDELLYYDFDKMPVVRNAGEQK